jgi:hypothetical protein
MNLLKKLWDFLFGSKEEEAIEEVDLNKIYDSEEPEETVQHCESHLRFRKNCPDCLRAVGII